MKTRLGYLLAYGAGVPAVTLSYAYLCALIIGGEWQRKEGDLPPIPAELEQLGRLALDFPFGYFGVDDIFVLPVLNGVFWGVLVVTVVCLLYGRHKKRAYRFDGSNAG